MTPTSIISSLWTTDIPSLLGVLFAICISVNFMRFAKRPPIREDSKYVLVYGWPIRICIIILFLLFSCALWPACQAYEHQGMAAPLTGFTLFLLSIFSTIEVMVVRVEFDESYIYARSPWRRRRQIPWNDIVECDYAATLGWYVIETRHHGKLRISPYLSGIDEFLNQLRKYVEVDSI